MLAPDDFEEFSETIKPKTSRGVNRTHDLYIMSVASYHCSTLQIHKFFNCNMSNNNSKSSGGTSWTYHSLKAYVMSVVSIPRLVSAKLVFVVEFNHSFINDSISFVTNVYVTKYSVSYETTNIMYKEQKSKLTRMFIIDFNVHPVTLIPLNVPATKKFLKSLPSLGDNRVLIRVRLRQCVYFTANTQHRQVSFSLTYYSHLNFHMSTPLITNGLWTVNNLLISIC